MQNGKYFKQNYGAKKATKITKKKYNKAVGGMEYLIAMGITG